MNIVKLAAVAVIGTCLTVVIKKERPEIALLTGIATVCLVAVFVLNCMEIMSDKIAVLQEYAGGNEFLPILFKIAGVTYICEFSASICRDAGNSAVAAQLEMAAKLFILVSGMPVVLSVIECIAAF